MTTTEAITKIQPVLEKYSYHATARGETEITLTDRKRQPVGRIDLKEPALVLQKYVGQRNMMGALVRNELCTALGCESGRC